MAASSASWPLAGGAAGLPAYLAAGLAAGHPAVSRSSRRRPGSRSNSPTSSSSTRPDLCKDLFTQSTPERPAAPERAMPTVADTGAEAAQAAHTAQAQVPMVSLEVRDMRIAFGADDDNTTTAAVLDR